MGRNIAVSASAADGTFVAPVEATRDIELISASVAWVVPQMVSGLVKALDERRQPELSHLRRVHRNLAAPADNSDSVSGKLAVLLCFGGEDRITSTARRLLNQCHARLVEVQVPKHAPVQRWQFEAWTRVWPLHFHEGAVTRSLDVWLGNRPSNSEVAMMREHMRSAITLARQVCFIRRSRTAMKSQVLCLTIIALLDSGRLPWDARHRSCIRPRQHSRGPGD